MTELEIDREDSRDRKKCYEEEDQPYNYNSISSEGLSLIRMNIIMALSVSITYMG